MSKQNPHIGSSLGDFLREEGILEETRAIAIKEAVAYQIQKAMEKENISKVEMARRMNTSRAALDRACPARLHGALHVAGNFQAWVAVKVRQAGADNSVPCLRQDSARG